jgi:3-deoxy-7-phosphoheptulonate synthase
MLIKLKDNLSESDLSELFDILKASDMLVEFNGKIPESYIRLRTNGLAIDRNMISALPQVEKILEMDQVLSLVSREHKKDDTIIKVNDTMIGSNEPIVIAGPCAVENEQQILEIAGLVKSQGVKIMRGGAYKPRTSPYSFSGLEKEGLRLLDEARKEYGLSIITEVLDTRDVEIVAKYSDILQVGSRNMQNYKLLKAVGRLDKPVMLKRGMSARLDEFLASAEYILNEGNQQVILCERGIRTFVEYTRNTLDLNLVPVIRQFSHLPIIVDPSHGTGRRDIIEPMSLAALAAGANGIMIEVHPSPDESWSDPEQAISPDQFSELMKSVNSFIEWRKEHVSPTLAY